MPPDRTELPPSEKQPNYKNQKDDFASSISYDQGPSLRGFSASLLEDNKSGPDNQIKELGQTELRKVLLQVMKGVLNKQ